MLGALLILPILLYAALRMRNGPISGASPDTKRELRSLGLKWSFGLGMPLLAGFAVVVGAEVGRWYRVEGLLIAAVGLTALAVLVLLVISARRIAVKEAFRGLALLRRFVKPMPFAYGLGWIGLLVMAMTSSRVLDPKLAFMTLIGLTPFWLAVPGALSVILRGLSENLSIGRGLWIFSRRMALDSIPFFILFAIAVGSAFPRSRMPMRQMEQVVFEAFEERAMQAPAAFEGRVMKSAMPATSAASADEEPGGLVAPSRVRRYFPETLLWQPELITGEDGHARLELPLADSITTWRLAMSAVSRDGELGAHEIGLKVFQDFFIDLDLPVALTQNDEVTVPVAVYNYLDRAQTVRLELREQDWFALAGSATETLTIAAGEVVAVSFRIEAREPGTHTLLVEGHGSTMADAVEREVRVVPDGEAVVETLNGRLEAEVEQEVFIPEHALAGANDLVLKIYPGAFSQVMEGLDGIFQMPYGCFEQTSSTTYPNVLVLDYLRQQEQIRPEVELKALEYINLGYQRLLTFEVPGGGFEWFGQSPAHTVLTAYGLLEFSDMAKVYEVDPAVISRTRDWLYSKQEGDGSWKPTGGGIAEGAINAFQGQVLRTTAYVAWAMASSGEQDARLGRALEYVAANAGDVDDPYTLALAANALLAGDRSESRKLLDRLDAMKQDEGDFTWWTSAGEGVTYSAGDTLAIETTAIVAYAYQEGAYRIDTAHRALAWLIEKKAPNGTWYSTQATVHAMRALLRGTGASGDVDGDVEVTMAVNGQPADALTITEDDADVYRLISLREHVRSGWNKISINVDGTGNLAYQVVSTHYLPWSESREPEDDEELSIDLEYDTVELATDDLLTCRVQVSYNRPGAADMAIVDLGIPPGFELLPEAFEEMLTEERIERYSVTARQVIMYFRQIESGRPVTFEYRMRAKYPLEVKTPQSAVYPYYEPSVRDETEPVVLTVR